jgi:hypothetical protein
MHIFTPCMFSHFRRYMAFYISFYRYLVLLYLSDFCLDHLCHLNIHICIFAINGWEYMIGGNPRYAAAVVEAEENGAVPPPPKKWLALS